MTLDQLIQFFKETSVAWTPASEAYVRNLHGFASQINARRILEVGIGPEAISGRTFAAVMRTGGTLVSVDIANDRPTFEQRKWVADMGVYWSTFHGDSMHVDISSFPETRFDLLYIDGDHGMQHVFNDYRRFSPYVRKGGLIVFDDYYGDGKFPELELDGVAHVYDPLIPPNGNGHLLVVNQ